jgi:carbamoylphosphate synthase large subunit
MQSQNPTAVTAARIESALDLISEVMVRHDRPQFAPYLDRLERELAAMQSEGDVMARARRRVEARAANDNAKTEVAA